MRPAGKHPNLATCAKTLAVAAALTAALAGCGSSAPSGSQVAQQLSSLLANQGNILAFPNQIRCVHQNGNQFICQIHPPGHPAMMLQVTDDGHNISAQP